MRFVSFVFFICLVCANSVYAQTFVPQNTTKEVDKLGEETSKLSKWGGFYNKNKQSPTKTDANLNKDNASKNKDKQIVDNPEDYIYKKVKQIDRPTLDGVKRGRTSVVPAIDDGKTEAEGYIYLYYSDFVVHRRTADSVMCDVKFQILTTFDRKLNTLAVRLKWPNMETPLSFIDVNPNQQYHMIYSLLGNGCYSMDGIPNVIINRCRIKGMSQEECARRVRWLKKK